MILQCLAGENGEVVKPLNQEMHEKKGFGKVDRELNFKYRETGGSMELSSEDTQSYCMVDLRWEVGPRIAKICRFVSLYCWGAPPEILNMEGRVSSAPPTRKEREDYEENEKRTVREIKMSTEENSGVSRSKCSTILYGYYTGRSTRTRTGKRPLGWGP